MDVYTNIRNKSNMISNEVLDLRYFKLIIKRKIKNIQYKENFKIHFKKIFKSK